MRAQDIRGMSALRRPEWNVDVGFSKKRNNPVVGKLEITAIGKIKKE